jgi:hypothetical protein
MSLILVTVGHRENAAFVKPVCAMGVGTVDNYLIQVLPENM